MMRLATFGRQAAFATMSYKALFIQTVRATSALPVVLREHADDVRALEEHRFDHSYIEFLDEQIRLSPRGPVWTERLNRRRADLLPFCDTTLLRGSVRVGDFDFSVEIDPKTRAVIHWEQYEFDHVA
jgi:hypothetical protein